MENLVVGDLRLEVVDGGPDEPIQVRWCGRSAERYPGKALGPYLATILAAAAERKVAVEQHFEKLDHLNSSTVTVIIQLIQDARSNGVKLALVYDHSLKWQKLSFDTLRVFIKDDGLLTVRSV